MDSILLIVFVLAPGTGMFMLLIGIVCGEAIRLIGRSARSALVLAAAVSASLLVAATFGWWVAAALVTAALTGWLLVWLKRSREEYVAELHDRADKYAQHEAGN